jgi:phosphatidylserine decarboxylase
MTTALHRRPGFLRSYAFLPHRAINRAAALVTGSERPRWLVDRAIDLWTRVENIPRDEFESRRFVSLDDFFLRRLRPGARPLGSGFISPADGDLLAHGRLDLDQPMLVKGQRLSPQRVVNGKLHDLDLRAYDGGSYAVVFLTPRGYHRVHAPTNGRLLDVRWIPGRYFPQNQDALDHIPRVYERNERATLRLQSAQGFEYLVVMVGASLIGGIHLEGIERAHWAHGAVTKLERSVEKGDELGHFAFGSTVVVLLPRGVGESRRALGEIRMGESLYFS